MQGVPSLFLRYYFGMGRRVRGCRACGKMLSATGRPGRPREFCDAKCRRHYAEALGRGDVLPGDLIVRAGDADRLEAAALVAAYALAETPLLDDDPRRMPLLELVGVL